MTENFREQSVRVNRTLIALQMSHCKHRNQRTADLREVGELAFWFGIDFISLLRALPWLQQISRCHTNSSHDSRVTSHDTRGTSHDTHTPWSWGWVLKLTKNMFENSNFFQCGVHPTSPPFFSRSRPFGWLPTWWDQRCLEIRRHRQTVTGCGSRSSDSVVSVTLWHYHGWKFQRSEFIFLDSTKAIEFTQHQV